MDSRTNRLVVLRDAALQTADSLPISEGTDPDPARERWRLGELNDNAYRTYANDRHAPRRAFAVLYYESCRTYDENGPSDIDWEIFKSCLHGSINVTELVWFLAPEWLVPTTNIASAIA